MKPVEAAVAAHGGRLEAVRISRRDENSDRPEWAVMRHTRWQAEGHAFTGPRAMASPRTLALADIATADRSARRSAAVPVPDVRCRLGGGGALRRMRS
jgi:hypothetical protein